jgi:hypothetical protein
MNTGELISALVGDYIRPARSPRKASARGSLGAPIL